MSLLTSVVINMHRPFGAGACTRAARGRPRSGALLLLTITALRWVKPFGYAVALALADMIVLELAAGRIASPGDITVGFLLFVSGRAPPPSAATSATSRNAARRRSRRCAGPSGSTSPASCTTWSPTTSPESSCRPRPRARSANGGPRPVQPALDAIATAGGEALTAMRRLVSVLRADDEASRTPGVTLQRPARLADNFAANGGPRVAFDIGQGVSSAELPPEVLTTLHRVLQESLTNIRKHAPGTDWVEIDVSLVPGGVRLRVRNYGWSRPDSPASAAESAFGMPSRPRRPASRPALVGMDRTRSKALGRHAHARRQKRRHRPRGAWEGVTPLAQVRRPRISGWRGRRAGPGG